MYSVFGSLLFIVIITGSADACPQYRDEIIRYSHHYLPGVRPSLIAGQVHQESRCNPVARSRVGAVGLMQIMPGTARDIERMCRLPGFDPLNPHRAIQGGICYDSVVRRIVRPMADNHNLDTAMLLAYNGGAGWVLQQRRRAINDGLNGLYADVVMSYCRVFRSEENCRENNNYPAMVRSRQQRYLEFD